MKTNYYSFVLFFLFIFSSGAQVKIWDRSISSPDPITQFPFKAEFRDLAVAPMARFMALVFSEATVQSSATFWCIPTLL
jgi:hypothetical protein